MAAKNHVSLLSIAQSIVKENREFYRIVADVGYPSATKNRLIEEHFEEIRRIVRNRNTIHATNNYELQAQKKAIKWEKELIGKAI